MEKYAAQEEAVLDHVGVDYMPLHDVVREFAGFSGQVTEDDFLATMDLLKYVVPKHNLRVLQGPSMEPIEKPIEEIAVMLLGYWYTGRYDEIDYGIWLDF